MINLESKVNYQLNKFPALKKIIKRVYQFIMYSITPKIKSEGNIVRVSPMDNKEYFFGYYDKSPWDITDRYMLCLRVNNAYRSVAPKEPAEIIIIDTQNNNSFEVIGETNSWNVQQGCMLQWLGPDYSEKIIYNDFRDGKYCSVIFNIRTKDVRIIFMPVYSVSLDGSFALSLDFSRLHRLRKGYGYSNLPDLTKDDKCPDGPCIWHIDLITGKVKPIMKYIDFANFEPRSEMREAEHKINHIMLNESGNRFMVLHRWFIGSRKYTRLVTVNVDGTDMYNLSDEDMTSHCFWKSDSEILAFARKNVSGNGYYLMRDKSQDYQKMWPELTSDGHPSYSPDGSIIVTDTYPNRFRIASVKCTKTDDIYDKKMQSIARVYAPFKYDNDTRCDLHPRWNRRSDMVCIDSVHEGKKGLYVIPLTKSLKKKIKIIYLVTSCKKSGPIKQTLNIIKNIDRDKFTISLVTLYEDNEIESMLDEYTPLVDNYYHLNSNKIKLFLKDKKKLYRYINKMNPDIVHSVGLIPAILAQKYLDKHVTTIRNYIYEDYNAKFGKVLGSIMARINLKIIKSCQHIYTCSESLSKMYKDSLNLTIPFIRNGVDMLSYTKKNNENSYSMRIKLDLPVDKMLFVYSGQFITRKDQKFAIEGFLNSNLIDKACLVLLGNGAEFNDLYNKYKENKNIIFTGNVSNVSEYLQASNIYISTSKSEGLPNGVIEAMSVGLPVVLSNILQHKEIYEIDPNIGRLYKLGDKIDFIKQIEGICYDNLELMGEKCFSIVNNQLNAKLMSCNYQTEYKKILKE